MAAGVTVGSSVLATGAQVAAIAIFTLIAASSVLVPVVGYLAAAKRMTGPLEALRVWLLRNNATVMTVLLVVIGVVAIGKGFAAF